jgi:hypothetical protein
MNNRIIITYGENLLYRKIYKAAFFILKHT